MAIESDTITTPGLPAKARPRQSAGGADATGPDAQTIRGGALWLLGMAYGAVAAALLYALAEIGFGFEPVTGYRLTGDITAHHAVWGGIAVLGALLLVTLIAIRRIAGAYQAAESRNTILSEAFQTLPAPRFVSAPDGTVPYVNAAFRHLFECEQEGALDALAERFRAANGSAREFERLIATARMGIAARAEIEVPLPGGVREWYEVVASPVSLRPGYISWRVEDVTAQRELEQVIRQEHETLFDFLENAPVGFFSVDEDGRFLFINQTLAQWLGFTPEQILGGTVTLKDVLASPVPAGSPAFDPFGAKGSQQNGEVALKGRDGTVLQTFISQTVVRAEDGGGLRTRSVVRDLRPEREWEQALRISEHRFKKFFQDAPVGIALVDSLGRIVECNRILRKLGASAQREVLGLPVLDLVAEEDRGRAEGHMKVVVAGASAGPVQIRLHADGDRTASLFVSRIDDSAGGPSGLIVHFLDTTDLKRLETQFAQSQKMQAVGQLAGGIAHDFNNLLTAMIGFCDLLLLRHRAGEQSFADIMQIKQNANRAANLVRQLLAFSRQQTVKPRVLNLTDVLADIANLLRRLIGEKIELKMIHGRDLASVKVDQGQFEQVIVNLAVNARDAMPGGGTLTIRTGNVTNAKPVHRGVEEMPAGEYVLVEVGDTGVGIPKRNIDRIFEPFYSTKEVGAGTGLGLSTVHGIVKQSDGYIFVDSVVGEGTKFSIFLPRFQCGEAAGEAAAALARPAAGDLTGAGTVLLVEDEDAVRLFSARALRNKGYKVLEARGGETAIELLKTLKEPVDLLITDIVMPDMDGPALVDWVRAREPRMRVICISGYAEETFRRKLDAAGDVHFLPKPFSLEQLAGKVKEVLRAPPPPAAA
jgi:two-component system cell cycle sensor histidine kinase/response regulator CckA